MGIARGMMKVLVVLAAIALVALAVEDAAEVKEMDESMGGPAIGNGGDDTHPAYIADAGTAEPQGAYAEGTGYYKAMNNFVGPKYGLPGYKESHNWNDDYDILSPLVFDYRFYRALIHKEPAEAKLMNEEDLKTEFSSDVQKKQTHSQPSAADFSTLRRPCMPRVIQSQAQRTTRFSLAGLCPPRLWADVAMTTPSPLLAT